MTDPFRSKTGPSPADEFDDGPDAARETVGDLLADGLDGKASIENPVSRCALLLVRRALAAQPGMAEASMAASAITVVRVPGGLWERPVATAWRRIVRSARGDDAPAPEMPAVKRAWRAAKPHGLESLSGFDDPVDALEVHGSGADRPGGVDDAVRDARGVRPIHAISCDPEAMLPGEFLRAADHRVEIGLPDAEILLALAGELAGGCSAGCLRDSVAEIAARVSPTHLLLSHRPGQTAAAFLLRLLLVAGERAVSRAVGAGGVAGLADLHGMGEAGMWGARTAADLRAHAEGRLPWSEVDCGVVLAGPPGCGKTTFAAALAASAGVPLVTASLQEWQGSRDGHLGHLLSAMRRSFEEARAKRPCVLLVDELDGFGDRAAIRHDNRTYSIQVLNAFLELLDGAWDRDGVLVVATCNDAGHLDPALLRSGRLERIVVIPHPDAAALGRILRRLLGDALPGADLSGIAEAAESAGGVGADAVRWCRGARRRARIAGRPMELADLEAELGPPVPPLDDGERWRLAVHEAGHALGYAAIGPRVLEFVELRRSRGGAEGSAVLNPLELHRGAALLTRVGLHQRIVASLAGRAAEIEVLGEASSGAGGSEVSDLAYATRQALEAVTRLGLDDHHETLVYRGAKAGRADEGSLLREAGVRARVASVLRRSEEGARSLVRCNRAALERVARALVDRGRLEGPEAVALMGCLVVPVDEPPTGSAPPAAAAHVAPPDARRAHEGSRRRNEGLVLHARVRCAGQPRTTSRGRAP